MTLTNLTWNCEGLSRNKYNLYNIIEEEDPSFIFISEPWLHLCDAPLALDQISTKYRYYLNSEDRHNDLLSLCSSRAHGGTITLWKHELDPHITVLEPVSSRILAVVLDKPGIQVSIHINVYLSTAGKESDFVQDLALLEDTIDDATEKYPHSVIHIRGDANAAPVPRARNQRDLLFQHFLSNNSLVSIPTNHTTYHHFTNDGKSDSSIDVILGSDITSEGYPTQCREVLKKIICGKADSAVDSSHDIIISSLSLPAISFSTPDSSRNVTAPRVASTKHKILWSEEGVLAYQELLQHTLPSLQHQDCEDLQPGAASVLFQITNHILTSAAKQSNKVVELSKPHRAKPVPTPTDILVAAKAKSVAHKNLLALRSSNTTKDELLNAQATFNLAKAAHQNAVRKFNVKQECVRDEEFHEILTKNPREVFRRIKSKKAKESSSIDALHVGDKLYTNDNVSDGFFDSISDLKTVRKVTSASFKQFSEDHANIIALCKSAQQIPKITLLDAEALLREIKPNVSDYFSITAAHYLHGGEVAIKHFCYLFNTVLENIEIAAADELNRAHAVILHKGHYKPKNLSSSYRTISSCPFLAKSVDIYLGKLSKEDWRSRQAATQFQGDGMSHDMASLLLTSTIHHSLHIKKPLFVLLLDAKSAFDLVLRKILVRRLFLDTKADQRIRYWDLRLSRRTTFCQWGSQLMGPIKDECGVEQGGPNSSDFYKIYNNEQINSAQDSGFGTTIGHSDVSVAAIGLADDTALVSQDIYVLQHLLQLTLNYCEKYQVQLSPSKTKLLIFSKHETDYVKYAKLISPIHIGDTVIQHVDCAEHVGVVRSIAGNLPHIQQRLASHRRALSAILFSGMARRHRANPLASLRANTIFGISVLFSGLASLILNKKEIETLHKHVKETVQNLLKLHQKTPEPVIFFISGTLPAEAILHTKQLTLFGAICRLPGNILNTLARNSLTSSSDSDNSWFAQIREICHKYGLPHPLKLLELPPSKEAFKTLLKLNIANYWQLFLSNKIRNGDQQMSSLKYFKPQFMSLLRPHPILTTVGNNSYETNKMIIQLRMLSGRFRSGSLLKYFSPNNSGVCELCLLEEEDLSHILLPRCPLLMERRALLIEYSRSFLQNHPVCAELFEQFLTDTEQDNFVQFILDCSTIPAVVRASQLNRNTLNVLFKICRTWCYSLHRTRLKLLGRWK